MNIRSKRDFQKIVVQHTPETEWVIVKPNWVDNVQGNYTEPEILDWLLESLPQNKLVIESYTPWRSSTPPADLKTNLVNGKDSWDYYKKTDQEFLEKTGIGRILSKHKTEYLNLTNEYWSDRCVSEEEIQKNVKIKKTRFPEFFSFIPQRIFNLKEEATLISLAKIKLEDSNPQIMASLSIKNLFGLIPHPNRSEPYHHNNHQNVPLAVAEIYQLYHSLFENTLSINEGIKSLVLNYCEDDQTYQHNQNLVFIDQDFLNNDTVTCQQMKIDPKRVPYLKMLNS